jgi:short subunit fatty acids transporter
MAKTPTTKKVTKKEKPAEIVENSSLCTATIKILGKITSATGVDVKDAISNLNPANKNGMAVLTVEKEGYKREVIIPSTQIYRLFNGGRLMKEIALKNISMRFT